MEGLSVMSFCDGFTTGRVCLAHRLMVKNRRYSSKSSNECNGELS
jgi:hypothetical protein